MRRVEGKVAFITGAARGQGRSHAVRLAQEGADIIAVDLCGPVPNVQYPPATPEDLAQTVKEVEALDRRIVASQVDTRDRDELKRAVDEGVAQLGKLDVVVANPKLGAMFVNSLPIDVTQPIDQSNAVLFLASDESRYVTALAMTVDAGNTQV